MWKVLWLEDRLASPVGRDSFNKVNFKGIDNAFMGYLSSFIFLYFSKEIMEISGIRQLLSAENPAL